MNMKHPWDWLSHAVICFLITLFRWDYAVVVGLTIELVQAESGNKHPLTKEFWRRLLSKDTLIDLAADGIGVCLGLLLRYIIKIGV